MLLLGVMLVVLLLLRLVHLDGPHLLLLVGQHVGDRCRMRCCCSVMGHEGRVEAGRLSVDVEQRFAACR